VQTNNATCLAIATVALNHFAAKWKPLTAIRFDKEATLVFKHGWFNNLHVFDDG
jgi:hypothetical protein